MKAIAMLSLTVMVTVMAVAQRPAAVTVLNLGTSTSLQGYSVGTRTMLWADDDLNIVVNFHNMGPGATPPGLAGYMAMDLGQNMGKTQNDWTTQIQAYAATLPATPDYYDACGFPSAGIYNPGGNTSLANAFLAYFAPNHANLVVPGYGGYSFGTVNMADHADTTKHLRWYNANRHTLAPNIHLQDIAINVEMQLKIR